MIRDVGSVSEFVSTAEALMLIQLALGISYGSMVVQPWQIFLLLLLYDVLLLLPLLILNTIVIFLNLI